MHDYIVHVIHDTISLLKVHICVYVCAGLVYDVKAYRASLFLPVDGAVPPSSGAA